MLLLVLYLTLGMSSVIDCLFFTLLVDAFGISSEIDAFSND
jgi:hypothetical protein